MNTLAQLQQALQAHVLRGELAVAKAIDETPQISADVRLRVYNDAYRLRLIEALESNFPALAKFLGDAAFARLTQLYLLKNPSRHFSIRWFGHQLAEFLRHFADYRDQPWLAELADWEWCIAAAFDATDASALTVEDLGAVAPEEWSELRFTPHPSVQRLALASNVVAIVKASDAGEPFPPAQLSDARVEWLIWRRDLSVQYRSMAAPEAAAFDALIAGATFEEICAVLTQYHDADEVPLHAAGMLKTWTVDECLAVDHGRH